MTEDGLMEGDTGHLQVAVTVDEAGHHHATGAVELLNAWGVTQNVLA